MKISEEALDIRVAVRKHQEWRSKCLNLMPAENIMSPLARELMGTDFHTRYANLTCWLPSKHFVGNEYMEEVDRATVDLGKRLFNASFVETHIPSATLACETVILALTGQGDLVLELEPKFGGFDSTERLKRVKAIAPSLRTGGIPFECKEMNIDADASVKIVKKQKPKLIMLGGTILLFPQPVSDIVEAADEIGAIVSYDAAHVFGLVAGKQFQDPFGDGARIICGSTHKTLFGPQGGLILSKKYDGSEKEIQDVAHLFIGGAHPNLFAVLGVVFAELIAYGEEYAKQTVKNTKALGEALYEKGFRVLCPEKGFTESHMVVVNVREMGGSHVVAQMLERANIIPESTGIPGVDKLKDNLYAAEDGIISGLRLGGGENARLGMGPSEMKEIATFFERVLLKREDPSSVAEDVIEFKKGFNRIHYCFDDGADPFEYFEMSRIGS
jgi:glycine hydroxymethyltransferase